MSRPVDPRLLRTTPALRPYLAVVSACQLLGALLIVAQAGLLSAILVEVFGHHDHTSGLLVRLLLLGAVGLSRAALSALQEFVGNRASTRVRAQLRRSVLDAVLALGPSWTRLQPGGRVVNATGPGVDALDGYVAKALPALVAAGVVPPILLARIAIADWQSGLLFVVMLPLVPVFMALVGVTTKRRVERQYALLARLSGHFLDLLRGLTTLTVYGQAARQEATLRRASEQYRVQTMSALRVAFLSALVLDLVAALSVAVVAVDVGLRLDGGSLSFGTALVVLLLAPELFAPLRAVGMQFHASQAGATAAADALDLIAEADAPATLPTGPEVHANGSCSLDRVSVSYPDRDDPALSEVSLTVQPGELVALTGRSGAGKSTVLATLIGFVPATTGQVLIGADGDLLDLATIDIERWRPNVAWLPQRPSPTQPTVAAEVGLGDPDADDAAVLQACRRCRAPLPDTRLGEDGGSVSAGQRRRIALARVLLRVTAVQRRGAVPLVLLDEPSEDLDRDTETVVAEVICELAGLATVVIATHSELLTQVVDRRISMADGRITSTVRQQRRVVERRTDAAHQLPEPASPPARQALPTTPLRLRGLLRAPGIRGRVLGAGALSGVAGLTGLGLTGTSIWLISRAVEHPNVQALAIAVVGVRTFAIGRALLRYAERLTAHDVALRLLVVLRAQVFAAVRPLGPSALGGHRRGDLLRRFVGDVDGLQDGLVRAFLPFTGAMITSAGACVLAGLLAPTAGVLLAVALTLAGLIIPWCTSRAAGDSAELAELAGLRDQSATALLDGLAELTAYGAGTAAVDAVAVFDAEAGRRSRRAALAAAAGTGSSGVVAALALPAVLAAGATAVAAGSLPAISLGVLAICVLVGFEAVAPLPSAFAAWSRCRAGLARVAQILATPPTFLDPARPAAVPVGAIGVDVAGLRLRPAPDARPVLTGARLRLEAGTRVALTGASGTGKSTLLAAVLRLLPAERGQVSVTGDGSGVDVARLSAADLPPLAAGSLQGDHVFDASLRDNLRVVAPGASDTELDAVAARCGLTGFIGGLPGRWSTPAGPDGASLSGGQRQRLLLARALLADPAVLVLDEPTAHLDADTERQVLADLLDATSGRTVLISTHRRLQPNQVDQHVQLEHAALVEVAPAAWGSANPLENHHSS